MSLLKWKSLWYAIGTSFQESQCLKLAGLCYVLILRATTIYRNTFVTFHKVFYARCGTNCIDSWYLPSSLLFILTRVPTHKKYRILCYPLRSNSGWLPIRCAYFILFTNNIVIFNSLFLEHDMYFIILKMLYHPLYPMIQPNFYIEELIQNTTSRARMGSSKLTMFWCLQAIIGGVVSRDFWEK